MAAHAQEPRPLSMGCFFKFLVALRRSFRLEFFETLWHKKKRTTTLHRYVEQYVVFWALIFPQMHTTTTTTTTTTTIHIKF
jgi:hypothetical protein